MKFFAVAWGAERTRYYGKLPLISKTQTIRNRWIGSSVCLGSWKIAKKKKLIIIIYVSFANNLTFNIKKQKKKEVNF